MNRLHRRAWGYGLLIALGALCALPNVLPERLAGALPAWYVDSTIALGLDLRGGSHLLLQVGIDELAREETLRFAEQVTDALREAGIRYRPPEAIEQGQRIRLLDAGATARAVALAESLAIRDGLRTFDVAGDGGMLTVRLTRSHLQTLSRDAVERSLDILRQRLDATGVVEPTVARQGEDAVIVQLPGVDDPARIRELLGTTAKLSFHLEAPPTGARTATLRLPNVETGAEMTVERRPAVEGTQLTDARIGYDQFTNEPLVTFELDRDGARRFAAITRENVGRVLAIVLDGRIISAPVIRSAIPGGSGQISGSFTVAEASDLALLLRAGALPAPLEVVEERTVGPDLGRDAIAMGLTTGLIGASLVVVSLFVLYGRWGAIACAALALNVVLIFGALSVLGATLTLPGIAGIVLAIGMAVDANILINERIREETRNGLRPMAALEAGFSRAFGTIVDSNVTTLIATSLLFLFGSGPVRGFAVTIAIGLLTSMFTAVGVTRLLMEWRVRRLGRRPLAIGGVDLGGRYASGVIAFMRARYLGLAISAVISLASLGLLIQPGLHRGVDFSGGTTVEVRVDDGIGIEALRGALAGHGLAEAGIQQFGSPGNFLIRAASERADAAGIEQIRSAVRRAAPDAEFLRVEMVGPRVSEAFLVTAFLALLIGGVGMLAYLWFRFEWPFAVAALATLALDLTKMLGFFALFGIEFNLAAVAALLTLIGYSVNDKVVVFDRIRENLRTSPTEPLADLFNRSITATLSRTVFTSMTTFLAMLPMGIAGGAAVASFAIPVLFGIVLGTSSSIFIAAPMVLLLAERWVERQRLFAPEPEPAAERVEGPPRRRLRHDPALRGS